MSKIEFEFAIFFAKLKLEFSRNHCIIFCLFQGQTLQLPVLSVEVLGSIPRTAFTRILKKKNRLRTYKSN